MICFFSSGDSIEVSPVEPMISTADVPWSSWNFSSVRNAAKSTEPSLLNGVIRATNEPVSILAATFRSPIEFERDVGIARLSHNASWMPADEPATRFA